MTRVSLDASSARAVMIRSTLDRTDGLYDAANPRPRFRRCTMASGSLALMRKVSLLLPWLWRAA